MNTFLTSERCNKSLILIILFLGLTLSVDRVVAQSSRETMDDQIIKRVGAFEDSIRKANPKTNPVYKGGELSLSFPQYVLNSRIPQIDKLPVSFMGTNVGGMIGNPIGKLKANAGLYYSNSAVPYSIDMLRGGASASLYFLRLKKVKYHLIEPYATAGLSYQRTTFYGHYLPIAADGTSTNTNYSTSEAPLLGRTGTTIMNVGTGVEYQLENDNNQFLHFFAEVNYGVAIGSSASNYSFDGTSPAPMTSILLGVNFGILK